MDNNQNQTFLIKSKGKGCHLISSYIEKTLSKYLYHFQNGICHLFIQSSTACLSLNENCDPTVRTDVMNAMEHIVPYDTYAAANVRSIFFGVSISLPFSSGQFLLGTWQGIYLCEFSLPKEKEYTIFSTFIPNITFSNLTVTVPSRGAHNITPKLNLQKCTSGLLFLCLQHTSASITLNQDKICKNIESSLNLLVPEKWNYEFLTHTYEGDDDCPAHIKSSLIGATAIFPVSSDSIQIENQQNIFLCEHRNTGGWGHGHSRRLVVGLFTGNLYQKIIKLDFFALYNLDSCLSSFIQSSPTKNSIIHISIQVPDSSGIFLTSPELEEKELITSIKHCLPYSPNFLPSIVGNSLTLPLQNQQILLNQTQTVWVVHFNTDVTHVTLLLTLI